MLKIKQSELFNLFIRYHRPIIFSFISVLFIISAQIKPAYDDQIDLVIGIAEWRHLEGPEINVQQNTYLQLSEDLQSKGLEDVNVVLVPATLKNANYVEKVISQFGLDVLVWGWYDQNSVRGYVDLANATEENGMTNSLAAYLENGGKTNVIQVLKVLNEFDYDLDGIRFCVPRWSP